MMFRSPLMKRPDKIRTLREKQKRNSQIAKLSSLDAGTLLLLTKKSDRACVEAVVTANYLHFGGINFWLENWRG